MKFPWSKAKKSDSTKTTHYRRLLAHQERRREELKKLGFKVRPITVNIYRLRRSLKRSLATA